MSKLDKLHVTAVRYHYDRFAPDDERGLDVLAASGAYGAAHVPFEISERIATESRIVT